MSGEKSPSLSPQPIFLKPTSPRPFELFDAHDVSFVLVTKSFTTTSSVGRLALNVLLSFARCEREAIGVPLPTSPTPSLNNPISASASFASLVAQWRWRLLHCGAVRTRWTRFERCVEIKIETEI
jgi:hypothetical protein